MKVAKVIYISSIIDPENIKYHQDYIDELLFAETEVSRYYHIGSHSIFKNYFKLAKDLDSDEFCNYVDNYNIGQSECRPNYKGPKGLSPGIAFFISYQTAYILNLLKMDLTDKNVVEGIQKSVEITFLGSKVMLYVQPAVELLLIQYVEDIQKFYDNMNILMWIKAGCFSFFFSIIYLISFLSLVKRFIDELWKGYEMFTIIPISITDSNAFIQNIIGRPE